MIASTALPDLEAEHEALKLALKRMAVYTALDFTARSRLIDALERLEARAGGALAEERLRIERRARGIS